MSSPNGRILPENVLGIIPARGGSKGIPGKNIRLLAGKPLLAYAAEAAAASGVVGEVILSTDSEEIAAVGRQCGVHVPFLRPPELASDQAPMLPVMLHAVQTLEAERGAPFQLIILLQPTAPMRRPEHLRQAVEILEQTGCDSVASVVEVPRHYSPHFVMKVEDSRLEFFLPEGSRVTRRQDAPQAYSRDGTVYAVRRDVLVNENTIYGKDCRPLIIPHDESANLDDLEDWKRAEELMAKLHGRG